MVYIVHRLPSQQKGGVPGHLDSLCACAYYCFAVQCFLYLNSKKLRAECPAAATKKTESNTSAGSFPDAAGTIVSKSVIIRFISTKWDLSADKRCSCACAFFTVLVAILILACLVLIGYWTGKTLELQRSTKTHDVLLSTTATEDISQSQKSFFESIYSSRVCVEPENIDPDVSEYVDLSLTVHDHGVEVAKSTWDITIRNTFEIRRVFTFYWLENTTFTIKLENITTRHGGKEQKNFTLVLLDVPGENLVEDFACTNPLHIRGAHRLCEFQESNSSQCTKKDDTIKYNCSCSHTVKKSNTHYLCLSESDDHDYLIDDKHAWFEFAIQQKTYNLTGHVHNKSCPTTARDACCVNYGDIFHKLEKDPHIIITTKLSDPQRDEDELAGSPFFVHIKTNAEADVTYYLVGVFTLSALVIVILALFWWLVRRRNTQGDGANCRRQCCVYLYEEIR